MKKALYNLIYAIIGIFIFIGCNDQEEDKLIATLRSGANDYLYELNNQEAIKRVTSIMYSDSSQKVELFKIVHISDPHLSSISINNNYVYPQNLLESVRFANQPELQINAMVATGDFISNEKKDRVKNFHKSFIQNYTSNNYVPSFLCTGNHDCNIINGKTNASLNRKELNDILFSSNQTNRNYYYKDVKNPQGGFIRFISLDMLDQPAAEYNTMYYAYFSQEQINWLGNIALKDGMTDNHSIIILTHYPFQHYSPDAKTYLCDGDYVHEWNMIPDIIEAFRSKTYINKTYKNKISAGKQITANFDFSSSRGQFICYLGGHAHCNAYFNIEELSNRNNNLLPQKMFLCTNQAPSEIGIVYNRIKREENSITSNSFRIYSIDTQHRKIYVTYFGAFKPTDKPDYPEIECITY